MTLNNFLEVFSSGYFITRDEVRVVEWGGDYPVMSDDLFEKLQVEDGPVVVKTGQEHYYPAVESAVPADTLALPDVDGDNIWRDVLVARPGHAERFVE